MVIIKVVQGAKTCPICKTKSMRVSAQEVGEPGSEVFVEVWKCLNIIGEDPKKICGYTQPLTVELKNGQLIRR